MKHRLLCCLLAVIMAAALFPVAALAEADKTFEVSTQEDFLKAVEEINAADTGSFLIRLQADITFEAAETKLVFKKNTVTILGEGHTLTMGDGSSMAVSGTAVMNLGASDYTATLALTSTDDTRCILGVNDEAALNMYDHVTFRDSRSGGQAGGIQLSGSAVFHMYGGTITQCINWASVAGGVFLYGKSSFTMHGGTISDCSGYQGGAVGIQGNASFTMNGGEIKNCTDGLYGGGAISVFGYGASFTMNSGKITGCNGLTSLSLNDDLGGGGIFVYTVDGSVAINGGEISNCYSNYLGGGILIYGGSCAIAEGMKVYNNHAEKAGDDILNYEGSLTLGAVPSGLSLDDCGHAISGWYVDGVQNSEDTPRWNETAADGAPVFLRKHLPESTAITTQLGLKAAHSLYSYTINYYLDGVKQDSLTETGSSTTSTLESIPDKCPADYVLDKIIPSNVTEPVNDAAGSFTVDVYYTATSKPSDPIPSLPLPILPVQPVPTPTPECETPEENVPAAGLPSTGDEDGSAVTTALLILCALCAVAFIAVRKKYVKP